MTFGIWTTTVLNVPNICFLRCAWNSLHYQPCSVSFPGTTSRKMAPVNDVVLYCTCPFLGFCGEFHWVTAQSRGGKPFHRSAYWRVKYLPFCLDAFIQDASISTICLEAKCFFKRNTQSNTTSNAVRKITIRPRIIYHRYRFYVLVLFFVFFVCLLLFYVRNFMTGPNVYTEHLLHSSRIYPPAICSRDQQFACS